MPGDLEISLLGELRVVSEGREIALPASRKSRALLAFLVATGRPHRRERLCELFWDLPDDPRAALRWALSKLRRVVDAPDRTRIVADRERAYFDAEDVAIDIRDIHDRLRYREGDVPVEDLEGMAERLDMILLDGLDRAGDAAFESWLAAEREDAEAARVAVLRQLATHPEIQAVAARKWLRLWHDADPSSAEAHERVTSPAPAPLAAAVGACSQRRCLSRATMPHR